MRLQITRGRKGKQGFSVVEAMVVVVIIAILAQLGLSRYRIMTAKSKQAEAKLNLHSIEELQELHFLEHGKYQTNDKPIGLDACDENNNLKNKLGFRPKDCEELRYKYDWTSDTEATATSTAQEGEEDKFINPGCDQTDQWTVTYEKGRIENNDSVIDKCK